jgi:hypothetical protein
MAQSPQESIDYKNTLSTATRAHYNSINRIFCEILQKNVVFNAKGFHHLHNKPDGTARTVGEIIHKLTLFPLVTPVIKTATSIKETRVVKIPASRKKGAKKIKATQYALSAVVGKKKPVAVRVIIMEVENSQNLIFWSVMKD